MADRIFAAVVLAVVLGYGIMAFAVIKAPFQYDPLGPETWPQILTVAAALCGLYVLLKPDVSVMTMTGGTGIRLVVTIGLLAAYAWAYEPLGFIVSTIIYSAAMAFMLGGSAGRAIAFGVVSGVAGYLIGAWLLDLNLPGGVLGDWA
ncbi:tripartite tricarboxylate transporter TctB family protein [Roseospira navarrensis]|uniref:Tripartite tricarboxylate transporter TctB family protein n=1 Tax=Roseospira navarrensis TaxID=140058 RepID=A0A7X1ZDB9_9PROT|nr:tripartite tricarboxylate transporter TctB family protein [Roseospira navarrensis]MQX36461.1 tripartite tricarboxylate transporter TctB family protein [Roseospira navarrensis]